MTSQQPGPLPVTPNRSKGSLFQFLDCPHHPPENHTKLFVVSMPRMRALCQGKASQSFTWEYESIFSVFLFKFSRFPLLAYPPLLLNAL